MADFARQGIYNINLNVIPVQINFCMPLWNHMVGVADSPTSIKGICICMQYIMDVKHTVSLGSKNCDILFILT